LHWFFVYFFFYHSFLFNYCIIIKIIFCIKSIKKNTISNITIIEFLGKRPRYIHAFNDVILNLYNIIINKRLNYISFIYQINTWWLGIDNRNKHTRVLGISSLNSRTKLYNIILIINIIFLVDWWSVYLIIPFYHVTYIMLLLLCYTHNTH